MAVSKKAPKKKVSSKKGKRKVVKAEDQTSAIKRKKRKLTAKQRAKQRSIAAKKGWETRRLRAQTVPILDVVEKITFDSEKPPKKKGLSLIDKMSEDEVREYAKALEEKAEFAGWILAKDLDELHRDGSIAVERSRLRHMGDATEKLLQLLKRANRRGGEPELTRVAREIAFELDVPLREVFTLFHSP